MTSRPWRAVASLRYPGGCIVLGRASAKTRDGLDRFVQRHTGDGAHLEVWEVLPLLAVAQPTQVGDSQPGYGQTP